MSMLAEGSWPAQRFQGYVETDFSSAGVTSNNNHDRNSYTLRRRNLA